MSERYDLDRRLAMGGVAEVFLARAVGAEGVERTVVLKRILPHHAADPLFVETFLEEARISASLDHPNLARVHDCGEVDGVYFISTEFVDGPDLRTLRQQADGTEAGFPLSEAVRIVALAADGIAHAHARTITDPKTALSRAPVHRHLSPENVFVTRSGAVKVVDFGIGHAGDQAQRAATGKVKGKLAYMPPEQLHDGTVDPRTDVYALGVVLYELLTGALPFDAVGDLALTQAILNGQPVRASARRPEIPETLDRLLERATARSRADRHATCRALHADLERVLAEEGHPVGAPELAALVRRLTLVPPSPQTYRDIAAVQVAPPEASESSAVTAPAALVAALEDEPAAPAPPRRALGPVSPRTKLTVAGIAVAAAIAGMIGYELLEEPPLPSMEARPLPAAMALLPAVSEAEDAGTPREPSGPPGLGNAAANNFLDAVRKLAPAQRALTPSLLKQCIELDPEQYACHLQLGGWHQSHGELKLARVAYQRFVETAPEDDPDLPRVRRFLQLGGE